MSSAFRRGSEGVAVVHDAGEQLRPCGLRAPSPSPRSCPGRSAGRPSRCGSGRCGGCGRRLGLRGRVPPRVEQEAVVGLGQVQAEAAGLEADEEDRGRAVSELVARPRPGRGCRRRGSSTRCRRRRAAPAPCARKPVNWLNTSARCPPATTSASCSSSASIFGCRARRGSSVDQAGMQAELAEQGQRPQDREPVAVDVVDQPQHLLPLALQVRSGRLRRCRGSSSTSSTCSCFGGQFGCHLFLGPPQHQRPDPASQPGQLLAVVAALDRPRVVLGEPGRAGEQPRRHDRQQRPQLHQVVLHRRAGDRELERRGQLPGALVGLGLVVLDELRLVQDEPGPRRARVGRRRRAGTGRRR